MGLTFASSASHLVTSESVTEGHPDKMCDQVSDAILDAIMAQDPYGRVACETCTTTGLVVVMGEISTDCYVDIPSIVRRTIREAGYTEPHYGFDCESCGVIVSIQEQSHDIAQGVDQSIEAREKGINNSVNDDPDKLGAGDQGMMIGFACNETPELMPLPISLAHQLCRQMAALRKDGSLPYLRPDGKSQVTVEYSYGVPKRVDTVIMSVQHNPEVGQDVIRRDMVELVAKEIIPKEYRDSKTKYIVNPTGRFVTGGPVGDTGLTGRKVQVDSYGASARHGGGAFSGKDPTKVDRSASYMARYVAKNLVAAGIADRLELEVSYSIGKAEPLAVSVETYDTGKVSDEAIVALISKHFDLRPGAIIRDLDLRRPIYKQTATYGHFGRLDLNLPWERTDKANILRRETFISEVSRKESLGS